MKKTGFGKVKRMLGKITPEVVKNFETANRENAEDVVDIAQTLISEKTGRSRSEIKNIPTGDGGQLIDFGRKAKVIEGERGPRPFANPAMAATKKKRRKRNLKAVRDAVKMVK